MDSLGRIVPAIRCVSVVDTFPDAESVEFVDARGEIIRSSSTIGALRISTLLADEALARSPIDPPELMASVFIEPDRPIRDARRSRFASFVLRVPDGRLAAPPSEGVQRTTAIDDRTVRVVVDLDAQPTGLGDDADRAALLEATPTLQIADDAIVALAARAAGDATDPREVAERLRRAVHRHISGKALSVGFATAAETVRTREGDCTEHGVLLAAVLRARGIPSRVASGLIYADAFAGSENIFGYHMWTQALLPAADNGGEVWVDLDATLPPATPYDATHITLAVSDLSGDGPANSMVALAPLMGRLQIDVEKAE
ncbi:MAG: transglutaminase-like domain-containing protein [Planctomycetota bacterium]